MCITSIGHDGVSITEVGANQRNIAPVTPANSPESAPMPASTRNTQNLHRDGLRIPAAPQPPVIAGKLLTGTQITFLEFLADDACQEYCESLLGGAGTAAGTMLADFHAAVEFHHFGHRRVEPGRKRPPLNPGKLTENEAAAKTRLKKFARLAYRGDPDRRGVVFWERVAWLLWNTYSALMAMRHRAEKIKNLEMKRIKGMATKRAKRASYMRKYRLKHNAKAAPYFKEESKQHGQEMRSSH